MLYEKPYQLEETCFQIDTHSLPIGIQGLGLLLTAGFATQPVVQTAIRLEMTIDIQDLASDLAGSIRR